jgi:hypothetical protein
MHQDGTDEAVLGGRVLVWASWHRCPKGERMHRDGTDEAVVNGRQPEHSQLNENDQVYSLSVMLRSRTADESRTQITAQSVPS